MEVVILPYAQYTSRQEKESFYLLLLQWRLVTVVVCCMGSWLRAAKQWKSHGEMSRNALVFSYNHHIGLPVEQISYYPLCWQGGFLKIMILMSCYPHKMCAVMWENSVIGLYDLLCVIWSWKIWSRLYPQFALVTCKRVLHFLLVHHWNNVRPQNIAKEERMER